MIGMSATLPNFGVLGTWWRAATYVTGFRPTPLVHRFVVRCVFANLRFRSAS